MVERGGGGGCWNNDRGGLESGWNVCHVCKEVDYGCDGRVDCESGVLGDYECDGLADCVSYELVDSFPSSGQGYATFFASGQDFSLS